MFTRAINGKHNTYIETHSVLEMAGSLRLIKIALKWQRLHWMLEKLLWDK